MHYKIVHGYVPYYHLSDYIRSWCLDTGKPPGAKPQAEGYVKVGYNKILLKREKKNIHHKKSDLWLSKLATDILHL